MPHPEVTAHPATAMRKAGGPRRPDAEQRRQVTRCSCRARRSRPTQRRQCARQVVRGVPTRNKAGRSLVAHAAPGGHGPPSDGNAQGRWSAASRRGTKLAGHSLLMPHPEVTAHPATAMRKAGGPRRPDAEQSWQVTRCSCRTRRSRPTQRRQCTRQVVRGVPTRNKAGRSLVAHAAPGGHGPPSPPRWSTAMRKAGGPRRPDAEQSGRSLVAHAAPGGHGPPSDGNAQGRWSAASRRGTNTQRIRALRFTTVVWERDQSPIVHHNRFLKSKTQRIDWRLRLRVTTVERDSDGWLGHLLLTLPQG